jgi:hypothetical protein
MFVFQVRGTNKFEHRIAEEKFVLKNKGIEELIAGDFATDASSIVRMIAIKISVDKR